MKLGPQRKSLNIVLNVIAVIAALVGAFSEIGQLQTLRRFVWSSTGQPRQPAAELTLGSKLATHLTKMYFIAIKLLDMHLATF